MEDDEGNERGTRVRQDSGEGEGEESRLQGVGYKGGQLELNQEQERMTTLVQAGTKVRQGSGEGEGEESRLQGEGYEWGL